MDYHIYLKQDIFYKIANLLADWDTMIVVFYFSTYKVY